MNLKPPLPSLHAELHTIASHTDTTATGLQLNELVSGGNTTLHTHNYQPLDAGLTSLAGLTYSTDSFVGMSGVDTFLLRTIAQTKSDLSLDNVENTALSTWAGTTNITTLGTIATVGNITIADGGIVGSAGEPHLVFDNTNDFLEVIGCKTGFNVATPLVRVHIVESAPTGAAAPNATYDVVLIDTNGLGGFINFRSKNTGDEVLSGLVFSDDLRAAGALLYVHREGNADVDFFQVTAAGGACAKFSQSYMNITGVYQVDDVQVVSNRGAAVANATDAATTMARLNDLLARCRAHGLIAT